VMSSAGGGHERERGERDTTATFPCESTIALPGNDVDGPFDASGTITRSYRNSPRGEDRSEVPPRTDQSGVRAISGSEALVISRFQWYLSLTVGTILLVGIGGGITRAVDRLPLHPMVGGMLVAFVWISMGAALAGPWSYSRYGSRTEDVQGELQQRTERLRSEHRNG
jgi:hypothetical protein